MKTYEICHREEYVGYYYVEANSEEEALEEFMQQVSAGKVDLTDVEMMDSNDEAILYEDE